MCAKSQFVAKFWCNEKSNIPLVSLAEEKSFLLWQLLHLVYFLSFENM